MALFCECSRTTQAALRGSFIQTLTENSIAIQNMRRQGFDRAAKDDNGSKEIEIHCYCIDKYIYVSLVFVLA